MSGRKKGKFINSSEVGAREEGEENEADLFHKAPSELNSKKEFNQKTTPIEASNIDGYSSGDDDKENPENTVADKSIGSEDDADEKDAGAVSSGEETDVDSDEDDEMLQAVKLGQGKVSTDINGNHYQPSTQENLFAGEEYLDLLEEIMSPRVGRRSRKKESKIMRNLREMTELERKHLDEKKSFFPSNRVAERNETERRMRIEMKRQQFQEVFPDEDPVTSPILDFNPDKGKVLVKIHKTLAPLLKPHQVDGIKFMYDCVIESIKSVRKDQYGSGCILAHSMGLGKTFQVVTFLHTICTNRYLENHIERVLIIVPYNVIENWALEFEKWFTMCNITLPIEIYEMRNAKTRQKRIDLMKTWYDRGGIMLISINLFTSMIGGAVKFRLADRDAVRESFLYPGPDLVIVDEGHMLKNDRGTFNQAISLIATQRRIVLTGTPLQNNLGEYYVMMDFIKKNLLGPKEKFKSRFQKPIEDGQHHDSTAGDVLKMKKCIHVLIQMLRGCIHRCGYDVLVPYLQPKYEYVLVVRLSEMQLQMYQHYLDFFADVPVAQRKGPAKNLFRDKNIMSLIWNHPSVVHDYWLESQGSTKANYFKEIGHWYQQYLDVKDPDKTYRIDHSTKFTLLFGILELCEKISDKLVIFSQSLLLLDLIEKLLKRKMESFYKEHQLHNLTYQEILQKTGGVSHQWIPNQDYFRIDGNVDSSKRTQIISLFNDVDNKCARLMLISTRAGGVGTNLVGANRAIIYDASFNPANDLQAIFRIYRLGQAKPVYVYRMVAYGTMEDKIYKRQIVKQSLSRRVIDEQQIMRHYRKNDLEELYRLDTEYDRSRVLPVSADDLLNELIHEDNKGGLVVSLHEHDSLLENKPEEDLTEEERRAAWTEYEKTRVVSTTRAHPLPTAGGGNLLGGGGNSLVLPTTSVATATSTAPSVNSLAVEQPNNFVAPAEPEIKSSEPMEQINPDEPVEPIKSDEPMEVSEQD